MTIDTTGFTSIIVFRISATFILNDIVLYCILLSLIKDNVAEKVLSVSRLYSTSPPPASSN